jgi:hypothetical protein
MEPFEAIHDRPPGAHGLATGFVSVQPIGPRVGIRLAERGEKKYLSGVGKERQPV